MHAFIDAQNVFQATQSQGWQLDLNKLRIYLKDKHGVTDAFYFIGYVPRNQHLYAIIQQAGFILQFKDVATLPDGSIKGNIDVNLTLHAIDTIDDYDQALLVSADGDFYPIIQYWQRKGKFKAVLSPANVSQTSSFLKRDAQGNVSFMSDMIHKLKR